jgi:hypothetical protein
MEMQQKLACRMGMGESGDEKARVSARKPCRQAHALSYLAFIFAILGFTNAVPLFKAFRWGSSSMRQ